MYHHTEFKMPYGNGLLSPWKLKRIIDFLQSTDYFMLSRDRVTNMSFGLGIGFVVH
jgi:hypothetical protein